MIWGDGNSGRVHLGNSSASSGIYQSQSGIQLKDELVWKVQDDFLHVLNAFTRLRSLGWAASVLFISSFPWGNWTDFLVAQGCKNVYHKMGGADFLGLWLRN